MADQRNQAEIMRDTLVTCLATKLLQEKGGTVLIEEAEVQELCKKVIVIETTRAQSPFQIKFTTCSLAEASKLISLHNIVRKPNEGQS